MPFTLDPELAAVLAAAATMGPAPTPARGDAVTLRANVDELLAFMDSGQPESPNVTAHDFDVPLTGGSSILARWYTKAESSPGSAIVFAHGGGMVCGSVATYERFVASYVEQTGVPFLSVNYRLAPEYPGLTPVEDVFQALKWLVARAGELGIDAHRIAVMGDSGGGGVAAGVAIAARDSGIPLAKQILIYPMLDDRNLEPDAEIAPFAGWTYDNNYTGWHALLGVDLGSENVSPRAVPARLEDFAGLAPAFIDVGELDIFRDENIKYAARLYAAGVSCELHVRPGSMHGFDRLAPQALVSVASWADRFRAIGAL